MFENFNLNDFTFQEEERLLILVEMSIFHSLEQNLGPKYFILFFDVGKVFRVVLIEIVKDGHGFGHQLDRCILRDFFPLIASIGSLTKPNLR